MSLITSPKGASREIGLIVKMLFVACTHINVLPYMRTYCMFDLPTTASYETPLQLKKLKLHHLCLNLFLSMSAEGDRGRCSPFPGSQDFPQSTINFHFGKSTHTHSDNGGRHLVLQQFPGKAGLDLTGRSLYFSKRAKGRRNTHLKRTGGVLRSVFLSIWCHLLRLQGHTETRQ